MSITYDFNGNLATELAGGNTATYTWDMDDKLVGLASGGLTRSYVYGYTGDRLQAATTGGTTLSYLYSKEDLLQTSGAGVDTVDFTQGPGIDDVLALTASSSTTYAYKNMLSSVAALADGAGAVTENHLYDAWGAATGWPAPGTTANPYGYTGREWDSGGMYYYRNRFYRPDLGRFLSEVPVISSVDGATLDVFRYRGMAPTQKKVTFVYVYVRNRPLQNVDPSGQWTLPGTTYCGPGPNDLPPWGPDNCPGEDPNCDFTVPNNWPPPQSPADRCCALHDLCYDKAGATASNKGAPGSPMRQCVNICDGRLCNCLHGTSGPNASAIRNYFGCQ